MSCHRENIVWQSPEDNKWYCGFYALQSVGEDEEWDVDYDFSRFAWVSTGCDSGEEAAQQWDGANPGFVTYATDDQVPDLDQMRHVQ